MSTQAIHADSPLPGYYWMRRERGGARVPVAIWRNKDTGELVCAVGVERRATPPTAVWTFCAENKIDKDTAKFAFEHGRFPDDPVPLQLSNLPDDPFEALKIEIDAQQTRAEEWLKARPTIMTQVAADLARNMQADLLALNKRADAMFTAEKAPILAATRACDDKYRFRTVVADVAVRLRRVFEKFMVDEESRVKAEAASKLKAEQDRIAAERAKLKEDDPITFHTSAPELPLVPEVPKIQAGGGIGRKASLQDVWVGTITDYREAALYFIDHPRLREAIEKLVQHQVKDLKASAVIPGVTVTKERKAA